VGILEIGLSAIGKLAVVAVLLGAFLASMAGVVYMSLSGEELTVPEITGKDFFESEKELAALGLKIKRRADRPSTEKMNTVLEQLPKAGETVKTGQLIFVVVSKAGVEGDEAPKSLIKDLETDDSEKIEEMISEKPKKARSNSNSNANAKKKADTTRDVNASQGNSKSDADAPDEQTNKADTTNKKTPDNTKEPVEKGNRNTAPAARPQPSPARPTAREARPRGNQP
jgi:hypothetical protein